MGLYNSRFCLRSSTNSTPHYGMLPSTTHMHTLTGFMVLLIYNVVFFSGLGVNHNDLLTMVYDLCKNPANCRLLKKTTPNPLFCIYL